MASVYNKLNNLLIQICQKENHLISMKMPQKTKESRIKGSNKNRLTLASSGNAEFAILLMKIPMLFVSNAI